MPIDLSSIPTDELHKIDYVEIPGYYKPSDWGKEFHRLRVDEALGAGAAGPGKTTVGGADAIPVVLVAEELCKRGIIKWGECQAAALHLRRLSKGLDTSIRKWMPVFNYIDPAVRYKDDDHVFIFRSGFRFYFGHCKDPNDWMNYRTSEFVHIFFDELNQFTEEQYQEIAARCRSDHPVFSRMLKIRAATNPSPGWVRDYFVKPAPQGRKVIRRKLDDGSFATRLYLPATIDDNPNKEFVAQYKRRLLSRPPHIRNALLYGDWWATADSYFADHWNPTKHVVKPFTIPRDWPVYRCLDWGFKSPGCVLWWAVNEDGTMVFFKELTFIGKDGAEVAELVRRIEEPLGLWKHGRSSITGPADTNLWGQASSAPSHADQMARKGVGWFPADKKSRQMNVERFLARLADADGRGPGILFFETMKNTVATIPGIPADPGNPAVPMKCNEDHWENAVEYACAYPAMDATAIKRLIARRQAVGDDDEPVRKVIPFRGRLGYGSNY
ncbi:MAG: phage terminase large subunit [Armatimonadota bacterium]|nr:phage terminase large subunit [Armatimonadota bacterium]